MPLTADDFAALYDRHARTLVLFFQRRTYDPEAAVDLMAETFAAAFHDRRGFRGKGGDDAAAGSTASHGTSSRPTTGAAPSSGARSLGWASSGEG